MITKVHGPRRHTSSVALGGYYLLDQLGQPLSVLSVCATQIQVLEELQPVVRRRRGRQRTPSSSL